MHEFTKFEELINYDLVLLILNYGETIEDILLTIKFTFELVIKT